MKLTSFSRGFWESAVRCKGAKANVIRDYDILIARKEGKTIGQLALKFNLSEKQISIIIHKYE